MKATALIVALLCGCGDDDSGSGVDAPTVGPTGIALTVTGRPSVIGTTSVKVTVTSNGSTRTDSFPVGGLPETIDVPAPIQLADWKFTVEGFDALGRINGRGTDTVAAGATELSIMLEPADFVVNTTFAGDQFLTNDFEAVGQQLAVTSTGQWAAAYRSECTSCDIYARRFSATGDALGSTLTTNSAPTTSGAQPAIVAAGTTTLALWNFTEIGSSTRGVACRTIAMDGTLSAAQVAVASENADVIAAAPLPTGNVVLTWQLFQTSANVVRTAIVQPDCTLVGSVQTVSQTSTAAQRADAAANGSTILYAWVSDGDLHTRLGSTAGVLGGSDTARSLKTSAQTVAHVRVVPFGTGFAMVVRFVATTTDGPGKLELYVLDESGTASASPILITDQSASDVLSNKSFGLATRSSDGALLVAWHVCTIVGSCSVYGQRVGSSGALVGTTFLIPFNTISEQVNPSVIGVNDAFVVAWNDSSAAAPDTSGTAVRARYIY